MKSNPDLILLSNIKRWVTRYGISHAELAYAMNMSPRTLFNRYRNPETFTLEELRRAAKKLNTTVTKLLEEEKAS